MLHQVPPINRVNPDNHLPIMESHPPEAVVEAAGEVPTRACLEVQAVVVPLATLLDTPALVAVEQAAREDKHPEVPNRADNLSEA